MAVSCVNSKNVELTKISSCSIKNLGEYCRKMRNNNFRFNVQFIESLTYFLNIMEVEGAISPKDKLLLQEKINLDWHLTQQCFYDYIQTFVIYADHHQNHIEKKDSKFYLNYDPLLYLEPFMGVQINQNVVEKYYDNIINTLKRLVLLSYYID